MFNKILGDLALSNSLADGAFSAIIGGESFNNDNSFVATLRALLLNRVGDKTVTLRLSSSNFDSYTLNGADIDDILGASIGNIYDDSIYISNVRNSSTENRKAFFDMLDNPEKGFVVERPEFVEKPEIKTFMADRVKIMNARIYVSEEKRTSVIFVEQINLKKWHYLQCFIPRYFPWFFASAPLAADEISLLKSLTNRSSDDYERIIAEFAEKFDMRSYAIKSVLGDFEKRSRRQQLRTVELEIDSSRNRMNELMARYSSEVEKMDDLNIRLLGLKEIINSDSIESELMDYFKTHKNLDPLSSDGTRFSFIVRTYLDGFDPDMYERFSKNTRSHLFEGYDVSNDTFRPARNRKRFMDAVFSDDPKLRIRMCAFYTIDIRGSVDSQSRYRYPDNCRDMLPNPHLQQHDCLGNHARLIQDRLIVGDTVGAIEQCLSSAKSINLSEGATIPGFLRELFNTDRKVIELPDGKCVSPQEAYKWLTDSEKEEHADA